MQIKLDQLKISRIIIVLILVLTMIMVFLRSLNHIDIGDDVFYKYVLNEHSIGSEWNNYKEENKVHDITSLIESQYNHYLYTNGRTIVHLFLQAVLAFTNSVFQSILVTILYGCVVWLLISYCYKDTQRNNPLLYVIAIVCWLYLLPSGENPQFYWLTYSINYNLTMIFVIIWMKLYDKLNNDGNVSIIKTITISLYSFIIGWTHEGFIVPLCGATFVYTILRFRCMKRIKLLMFLSLWIGGSLLVISPGNFERMGPSSLYNLINGLQILGQLRLFWVAWIVMVVTFFYDRKSTLSVIKNNVIIGIASIIAVLFGLVANSSSTWSMAGAEFYSAILMFKVLPILLKKIIDKRPVIDIMSIVILIIVLAHQAFIFSAEIKMKHKYIDFLNEYSQSPYGYAVICENESNSFVRQWVFDWFNLSLYHEDYIMLSLAVSNGTPTHKPIVLGTQDYKAIFSPDSFFIDQNKKPGLGKVYEGERYYWIKSTNENTKFTFSYEAPRTSMAQHLYEKIIIFINASLMEKTHEYDQSNFVIASGNDSVRMFRKVPSMWRSVKEIN